jgi:hypothetical protein
MRYKYIRVIKQRRKRWMWYAADMIEIRNVYKILIRKPVGKRHLGRPRISFKFILKRVRGCGWHSSDS